MPKNMTVFEMIRNASACQEIKNLHVRHCYMHCAGRNIEEIDNYWLRDERASWGHMFGKWITWTGVKFGWRGSLERQGMSFFLQLSQVLPQTAGLDPRPLSEAAMQTLVTDIIEVAADGHSAWAYFYTLGAIYSTLDTSHECEEKWLWERNGIDYMKDENGVRKSFTIQVCLDIMAALDFFNPAAESYRREKTGVDARPPPNRSSGQPDPGRRGSIAPIVNDPVPEHAVYSVLNTVHDPLPWPEPYDTFGYIRSSRYRVVVREV